LSKYTTADEFGTTPFTRSFHATNGGVAPKFSTGTSLV
jgi:hypothetical protein